MGQLAGLLVNIVPLQTCTSTSYFNCTIIPTFQVTVPDHTRLYSRKTLSDKWVNGVVILFQVHATWKCSRIWIVNDPKSTNQCNLYGAPQWFKSTAQKSKNNLCTLCCSSLVGDELFSILLHDLSSEDEKDMAAEFFESSDIFMGTTGDARNAYETELSVIDSNILYMREVGSPALLHLSVRHDDLNCVWVKQWEASKHTK